MKLPLTLCTLCAHFVYTLYTLCVLNLFTICAHFIYTPVHTRCKLSIHFAHFVHTFYTLFVLNLFTLCAHFIYTLCANVLYTLNALCFVFCECAVCIVCALCYREKNILIPKQKNLVNDINSVLLPCFEFTKKFGVARETCTNMPACIVKVFLVGWLSTIATPL